jgi:hypothetical protein
VDEPRTSLSSTVGEFFVGLKNYEHKKPMEELAIPGMTIKEFWQHHDKDYTEFEYGKLIVPKHILLKFTLVMKKFHECYYLACVYVLNFIEANISGDIFKTCRATHYLSSQNARHHYDDHLVHVSVINIFSFQVF